MVSTRHTKRASFGGLPTDLDAAHKRRRSHVIKPLNQSDSDYNSEPPHDMPERSDEQSNNEQSNEADQSIDESVNAADQSIDESVNESIDESINESVDESGNESIDESLNGSINESFNESIDQSADDDDQLNQSVDQSDNQSEQANQSDNYSESEVTEHKSNSTNQTTDDTNDELAASENAEDDADFDFSADNDEINQSVDQQSDSELDDEFEIDDSDLSMDEEDAEDDDKSTTPSAAASTKEDKTTRSFGDLLSSVLSRNVDSVDPILAQSRKPIEIAINQSVKEDRELRAKKRARTELRNKDHHPAGTNEREKKMQKIATRGVIQLFNAVQNHRRTVKSNEAAQVKAKAEIMPESITQTKLLANSSTKLSMMPLMKIAPAAPKWNALREDFMLGSKLTDWDRAVDDSEDEQEQEMEVETE